MKDNYHNTKSANTNHLKVYTMVKVENFGSGESMKQQQSTKNK